MPSIITIQNIEETISNLNYRSETTLKSKLIRAVRNFYTDENSIEALTSINTEELVKYIWDTGDDSALIKNKKKNFSSVKSSVNSDLKKLYQQGNNPQGIIINHNNVFDISDEAKNKALSDIADIIREKEDTSSKISLQKKGRAESSGDKALADIVNILQGKENDVQSKISKISGIIQEILTEAISRADTPLAGAEAEQIKKLFDNLALQSQGPLTAEVSSADDKPKEIIDNFHEQSPQISTVINSVNEMLAGALAMNTSGLNDSVTDQIKNLFGQLTDKVKSALGEGRSLDDIGVTTAWEEDGETKAKDAHEEISSADDKENAGELIDIIEGSDIDQTLTEIRETDEGILEGTEEIIEVIEEILEDEFAETTIDIEEEFSQEKNIEDDKSLAADAEDIDLNPEDLETVEIIETMGEIVEDDSSGLSASAEEIISESFPGEKSTKNTEITETELSHPDKIEAELTEEQFDEIPGDMPYEEITEAESDNSIFLSEEGIPEETFSEEIDFVEPVIDDDFADTVNESAEINDGEQEDIEIAEEAFSEEIEEIIEESAEDLDEVSMELNDITGKPVDEDLQSKADILTELASAAKVLEKIGPDLSNNFFSEEEIKQKAKLLSEEFDSYLSMRERFYNQHILIKSGNYSIGSNEDEKGLPLTIISLREFYIGKFPVANALFEIFIEQTGYITTAERHGYGMVYIPRMQKVKNLVTGTESFIWNSQLQHKRVPGACWYRPSGPSSTLHIKRIHPVVQVSLEDACAFAAWTGKRIPTEAEWEAATRTSQSYLYPWGSDWQDDACNLEKSLQGDTTPVDQYIKFANDYEVVDSLGNVLEWTLDPWTTSRHSEEEDETFVVKGASWISDCPATLTGRQPAYKDSSSNILGFRCIAI
ncbi:MAG: SUMF1/EgtB/PvdO family nonheme iron enzyme [Smithella sp.]